MAQSVGVKTGKLALVTVGTTEFDLLIERIDREEFVLALKKFGFEKLLVQRGRGSYEPSYLNHRESIQNDFKIDVEIIRFHDHLADVIARCDLLIGHCGAGTILDAVSAGTKMIVVVNDSLQGNHQMELASVLKDKGFCMVTTPVQLQDCLASAYDGNFLGNAGSVTFPILEPRRFSAALDDMFDFAV